MKRAVLERLLATCTAKQSVVLITDLRSGSQWLVDPTAAQPLPALAGAVADALARDASRLVDTENGPVFVQPFQPAARLVVVGAVHIAQPLARMAALAGFEVVIVDPRTAFATEERFPNVTLSTLWPDAALAALDVDRRAAIVTLTHDPKLDDPALAFALRSPCFYVGSLGSKKTHAARLARLRELGFDDAALARIRGPAGLSIRARSPAEIAVSILAEVIAALRAEGDAPGA